MQTTSGAQKKIVDFAMALAAATKNYTMYPSGHSIARKHLRHTFSLLETLLADRSRIRLDVKEIALYHEGTCIYRGANEESDLAYLLGRDGVHYLEFLKGIQVEELQDLLTLINTYRLQDENQDGDIVTALWEKEYPHIRYKAVDILTLDGPAIDLSGFRVTPDPAGPATPLSQAKRGGGHTSSATTGSAGSSLHGESDAMDEGTGEEGHVGYPGTEGPPVSIALAARGQDLWSLSLQERYELEQMIGEEETRDNTEDVMELLLITLVLLNDKDEFVRTLKFLQDRVIKSLKNRRVLPALKVLKNLKNIQRSCSVKKPWARPLLLDFFAIMSRPESLRDLEQYLLELPDEVDTKTLETVRSYLCLLSPEILARVGLLYDKTSAVTRQMILAVIKHHGKQHPRILAESVALFPPALCEKIFPIAEWMKTDDGTTVFTRMALHSDRTVSRRAFNILVRRDTLEAEQLFPLIDDPDPEVRKILFTLLGKGRNPAVEKLLLDYLREKKGRQDDRKHLTDCYLALGRCGSTYALPLLEEILLSRKWGSMLNMDAQAHRLGAAQALAALNIPEATDILKKGAAGIRPDIRRACRKALGH